MKRLIIILFILLQSAAGHEVMAQAGGDNTYEFLNLPWSARGSALGGTIISLNADDPAYVTGNPALVSNSMAGMLSLGYASYLAGIGFGSAHYILPSEGNRVIAAGINWLSYGDFTEADNSGNITGTFRASEYALNFIYSRVFDSVWSVGVNVKPVISQLESYTSLGTAVDLGASVTTRDNLLTAGIVIKNIGMQFTTYAGESREQLPFEIQAGVSKRLPHAPFRFTFTLRNLQKWDLTHSYDTTVYTGAPGSAINRSDGFAENLFRHALFGIELLPHRSFWLGAGYNYQRRSELKIETGGAAAGFSWGFGFNISGLSLVFSRATYHLAGGSSQFSLSFNPGTIYRKITE